MSIDFTKLTPEQMENYTKLVLNGEVAKELARRNVMDYAKMIFPNYREAPHNKLIADTLTKVAEGRLKRVMIFAPPRHGKSYLTSEAFPSYYLGRFPDRYIIHCTYSDDLALDFGAKVKNHMRDPLQSQLFPRCSLKGQSQSQAKLSTSMGGAYFAVGVGGAITGRGAHLLLIDDPIKGRAEADSETIRRKLKDWYKSVAYTRLMPKGAVVIIQTRWHYDDLAGWLIEEQKRNPSAEKWTIIDLKAIAEEGDILGRRPGEALWPSDFPIETLLDIKNQLGTREFSSLYQQNPTSDENAIIKVEWFNRYQNLPTDAYMRVHSWDTAIKDEEVNDPTAFQSWYLSPKGYYLADRLSYRLQFPDLVRLVTNLYERDKPHAVLIEDKGSGQQLLQVLRTTTRIPVIGIQANVSKIFRAQSVAPTIESGCVYLPEYAAWLYELETQIAQFPAAAHDDDVDAMTQALGYLIPQKRATGLNSIEFDKIEIPKIYGL